MQTGHVTTLLSGRVTGVSLYTLYHPPSGCVVHKACISLSPQQCDTRKYWGLLGTGGGEMWGAGTGPPTTLITLGCSSGTA